MLTFRDAIVKYSEDQPREPAGSPEGGQWSGGGGSGGGGSETGNLVKWSTVETGDKVSGLEVTDNIPNMSSISASLGSQYEILDGVRSVPVSDFKDSGKPSFYSATEGDRVRSLAAEIDSNGYIDPLIVVVEQHNMKEGPYVLEGGHRFDALKLLGKKQFPALVVVDTERKVAKAFQEALQDVGAPITPIKGSKAPPDATRSQCALTGDPVVDAVINGPTTSHNIDHPVIDRSYDVPYGSGGSDPLEDPTTFVDRHVPRTLTVGDVTFDPAEPWLVHENVEQSVMEKLTTSGWDDEEAYRVAHFCFAQVAEHAWYAAHGIDPKAAEGVEKPWLAQIQHEDPEHPPPNLYSKPYPHSDVTLAQGEPVPEARPSDDEVARGRALIAAAYEVPLGKAGEYDESQHPRDEHGKWTSGGGSSDQLTGEEVDGLHQIVAGGKLNDIAAKLDESHDDLEMASSGAKEMSADAESHLREEGEPDPDLERDVVGAQRDAAAAALRTYKHLKTMADRSAAVLRAYEQRLASHGIGSIKKGDSAETPSYKLRRALHDYLSKNVSPQAAAIMAPEVAARTEQKAMEVLDDRVRDALRKHDAKSLEAFEVILDRISKLQPAAGDVHAPTALGNDKKGKRKNFKALLEERRQKPKDKEEVDKSAEQGEPWEVEVVVTKAEDVKDQHLMFGFASMAEMDGKLIIDKQGDMIDPEDLEKAAYDFVLYHRRLGDMHERIGVGDMVESMVFTKQKQELLGIDLGVQGWWVGFKVTDEDLWKRVKAGELPEFSIGGRALRMPT